MHIIDRLMGIHTEIKMHLDCKSISKVSLSADVHTEMKCKWNHQHTVTDVYECEMWMFFSLNVRMIINID